MKVIPYNMRGSGHFLRRGAFGYCVDSAVAVAVGQCVRRAIIEQVRPSSTKVPIYEVLIFILLSYSYLVLGISLVVDAKRFIKKIKCSSNRKMYFYLPNQLPRSPTQTLQQFANNAERGQTRYLFFHQVEAFMDM